MAVNARDLHQHLARYQAHHQALRDHHHHVAHGVAAERAVTAAAAATSTSSPPSLGPGPARTPAPGTPSHG
jgi:hypothetical protein